MTRPMRLGPVGVLGVQLGGDPDAGEGNEAHDCCDPTPPPDRAADVEARVPTSPTTDFPIVQIAEEGATNSTRVLATPATVGNTLIGVIFDRDAPFTETPPLGGWTQIAQGIDTIANDRGLTMMYHVVEADETPYTQGGDELTYTLTPSSNEHTLMFELAGTYDSIFNDDDNVASTTAMNAGGPVTPGTGDTVFIFGAAVIYSNVGGVTEYADVASLRDFWSGFSPFQWAGYMIVDNASGAYTVGGTMSASHYAGVTAVFTIAAPSLPAWDVPAPNTVDGDDATYHEVEGPDVLRVDLGGLFRIVRARLLMGTEDPGSVTYRIRAATLSDFSDAVELDVATFATTGSFTADDLEFTWQTTESYRYFELSGADETRRIYAFELYEPTASLGEDHVHSDIQDQIDALADAFADHTDLTQPIHHNLIINGRFRTNQRGYASGGSLASGDYGFDRWKATAAGTTLTFTAHPAGQEVTINSGKSIAQIIERAEIVAGDHVLTWDGTALGRVYNVGDTPPSYAASPISVSLDGAAHVTVEFEASGGTATLLNVKLERGTVATPFELLSAEKELLDCQRFFQAVAGWMGFGDTTTVIGCTYQYPVPMRATPTMAKWPSATLNFRNNGGDTNVAAATWGLANQTMTALGFWTQFTGLTSITVNRPYSARFGANTGPILSLSAEL